jgi:hypothetical protein
MDLEVAKPRRNETLNPVIEKMWMYLTTKICPDTSILTTSNMGWRK